MTLPPRKKSRKPKRLPGEMFINENGALDAEPMTPAAMREFRRQLKKDAKKSPGKRRP